MNYSDYALMCKAMGDETRIKIIDMLRRGRLCACKILDAFECTQPTLSYHMKILCESGLVSSQKEGKWMHYTLNKEIFDGLARFLTCPCKINENCSC